MQHMISCCSSLSKYITIHGQENAKFVDREVSWKTSELTGVEEARPKKL
jgi:hypothetical protein